MKWLKLFGQFNSEIVGSRRLDFPVNEFIHLPTETTPSDKPQFFKTIVGGPPQKIKKEGEAYWKIDPENPDPNQFALTFGQDKLQIKEFMQGIFPNSNLDFLGAGFFGFAMEPKGKLNLPPSFTENNFFGVPQPEDSEVVIKFTTYQTEANKIKELIQKQRGIHQGIANYWWIKEVKLPQNFRFSSAYILQDEPLTHQQRKELAIKMRSPKWWETPEEQRKDFNLTAKDKKELARQQQNFIELLRKKGESKKDKVFIICLDKVKKLTQKEKNNVQFCFRYLWDYDYQKKSMPVVKSIYFKEDRMKKYWFEKLREKRKEHVEIPDFPDFKETLTKLVAAIEKIGPDNYKKLDLHEGNIGKKGKNEELVFFDVYA